MTPASFPNVCISIWQDDLDADKKDLEASEKKDVDGELSDDEGENWLCHHLYLL